MHWEEKGIVAGCHARAHIEKYLQVANPSQIVHALEYRVSLLGCFLVM